MMGGVDLSAKPALAGGTAAGAAAAARKDRLFAVYRAACAIQLVLVCVVEQHTFARQPF